MIKVTKLNGAQMVLNAELIESVEAHPDTVVVLHNDKKFVIRESVEDVVREVIEYKRLIYSGSGPFISKSEEG